MKSPLLKALPPHFIAWTIFALFPLLASGPGCGPPADKGNKESGIALTYWPAPNSQEIRLADSLVRVWNRLHPDITVTMQPIPVSQSTEEVLLAAIAGKTTPDVCSNIWPGALDEYTRAGGLVALDKFPAFDSIVAARTSKELLETFRSPDGHFYQLPWKTNPVMMFYNKRLFEEAGIREVPRTYGSYLDAARKVTRDVDGDGRTDIWMGERDIRPIWWQRLFDFYPFYIAASGGKTLFTGGDVSFGDSAAVQVFAFFEACYRNQYYPRTFFQGGDPFDLEEKATHFAGPWQISHLQSFAPNIRYGVAPIPVPDNYHGTVFTSGDYKNIAIFGNSKHPRESWEFVKFLVSAEHDLLLLEITNQIPVRGDLLTNPLFEAYFRNNPPMVKFAEQAVNTRGMDAVPDLKEIFDAIAQEYERCAVYSDETPADAVTRAVQRTHAIIVWNQ